MKLKTLAIMTGVLAVLAVAGVLVQRQLEAPPSERHVGNPLLEELDMARAATVAIRAGEDKVTLRLENGAWTVEEQQGFPASEEKIRRFLFKLSGETVQHKVTENPKKLAALGLLSMGENNGKFEENKTAIRFSISDAEGKPLFELLIGNDRLGKVQDLRATGAPGGQYVRFPGERAAYLIGEPLFIDTKPQDWLKTKVFTFGDDKLVKTMRISMPGKKDLLFTRKDGKAGKENKENKETKDDPGGWKLEGVAAGKMDEMEATLLARRLRDLEIIKVAEPDADSKKLGREKVGVISFELFDKRSYRIEVGIERSGDDFRFITVSGALDPTVTDRKLKTDVEELNGLFAKRVVGIYNWEGEQLLKKRADFIEAKK